MPTEHDAHGTDPAAAGGRRGPWRLAAAFGRFWWGFIVGETPELAAGTVLCVVAAALVVHGTSKRWPVVVLLPVLVTAVLVLSVWLERRRTR